MPLVFPTPSHLCRIAEPPQPAYGLPVQTKTHTAKNFFPTYITTQFSTLTSSMAPPSKRDRRLHIILSRGLDSTNRRFVLRRPDHFPNGVVSTIFQSATSLRTGDFQKATILPSSAALSSSGVARRA